MEKEKVNLDDLSGDQLWQIYNSNPPEIVSGIVREIEAKVIGDGGWNAKDNVSEALIFGNLLKAEGEKLPIRTPKKQPYLRLEIAIDAMDYTLLIKNQHGWMKARHNIKTINIKKN